MERISDAAQFESDLQKERLAAAPILEQDEETESDDVASSVFPIIPTEGEIMALIDLVSEGKVDLSIDTSTLSEKTTRFDDFGTRQASTFRGSLHSSSTSSTDDRVLGLQMTMISNVLFKSNTSRLLLLPRLRPLRRRTSSHYLSPRYLRLQRMILPNSKG
jgi:hypothetical protein